MITEQDLQEAIAECEGQRNPSANNCLKLAAFYALKDRMYPDKQEDVKMIPRYSYAGSVDDMRQESDFRKAAAGVDPDLFMDVMDELMTTVKAIIPNLYDGVMRRLS